MMQEQILAQALLIAGEPEGKELELLRLLCSAAASSLAAGLKPGLEPEDISGDFTAAASLYAVAAWEQGREQSEPEEFRAGDLTVRRQAGRKDTGALCRQADALMGPYLADRFAFLGV